MKIFLTVVALGIAGWWIARTFAWQRPEQTVAEHKIAAWGPPKKDKGHRHAV